MMPIHDLLALSRGCLVADACGDDEIAGSPASAIHSLYFGRATRYAIIICGPRLSYFIWPYDGLYENKPERDAFSI